MPPESESFPALKLQGNKSLSRRRDLREAPGQQCGTPSVPAMWFVRVAHMWPAGLQTLGRAGGRGWRCNQGKRRVMPAGCLISEPAATMGNQREIGVLGLILRGGAIPSAFIEGTLREKPGGDEAQDSRVQNLREE